MTRRTILLSLLFCLSVVVGVALVFEHAQATRMSRTLVRADQNVGMDSKSRQDSANSRIKKAEPHGVAAPDVGYPESLRRLCGLTSDRFSDYEEAVLALEWQVRANPSVLKECLKSIRDSSVPRTSRTLLLGMVGAYGTSAEMSDLAKTLESQDDEVIAYAGLNSLLLHKRGTESSEASRRFWRLWYYTTHKDFQSATASNLFADFVREHETGELLNRLHVERFLDSAMRSEFSDGLNHMVSLAKKFSRSSSNVCRRLFECAPNSQALVEFAMAVIGDAEVPSSAKNAAMRYLANVAKELSSSELEGVLMREKNVDSFGEAASYVPAEKIGTLLAVRYWSDQGKSIRMKIINLCVSRQGTFGATLLRDIAVAEPDSDVRTQLALELQSQSALRGSQRELFVEVLRVLSRDASESVRINCAHVLSQYLSEPGAREILESMASRDSSERVRTAARTGLTDDRNK